jgi:hypothetical protein
VQLGRPLSRTRKPDSRECAAIVSLTWLIQLFM